MNGLIIITIITSVITAGIAGYLFRMAVEDFKEEQIIITKFFKPSDVPDYIWATFGSSIFAFLLAIVILAVSIQSP